MTMNELIITTWMCAFLTYTTGDMVNDLDGVIVDMTHTLTEQVVAWGKQPGFKLKIELRNYTDGGFWYESNSFSAPEHIGTHLDAPSHFAKNTRRSHEIPIRNVIGQAIHLDVSMKVEQNPVYKITVADLKQWEEENGEMPPNSIILFDCGWTHKWPNASLIYGTPDPANVSLYRFPGIDPDTATWITTERPQVTAVAIDTPSVDYSQSTMYETHQILGAKNIVAFENVANMHLVPIENATIIALPMKMYDGSGSPARIIAIIPRKAVSSSSTNSIFYVLFVISFTTTILIIAAI